MPSLMLRRTVVPYLLASLAAVGPAQAQTRFFQGKQLTILVNFAPGGPTDTEARLIARHLGRELRGKPAVTVRNMTGSSGVTGANWLATSATPDGLTLGYLTDTVAKAAIGAPDLKPEIGKLFLVAARTGISVTYARTQTGEGLKAPGDLLRQRLVIVGGQLPASDIDIRLRMQLDLVGVHYRYLPGFEGATAARLAFQRGDVDVLMDRLTAYNAAIEPSAVDSGKALPLWIDPIDDGARFSRSPAADGIPALTFTDFIYARSGKLPHSDLFRAWRIVNQIGTHFLRILALPPGSPAAAATEIRAALDRLADDQAFREDALKSMRLVPNFETDPTINGLFQALLSPEPGLKALIRSYANSAGPDRPVRANAN